MTNLNSGPNSGINQSLDSSIDHSLSENDEFDQEFDQEIEQRESVGPQNFLTQVRHLAEQAASSQGCYLYDLEFVSGPGGRALRVYIDRDLANVSPETSDAQATGQIDDQDTSEGTDQEADQEADQEKNQTTPQSLNTVSIDDCANVSRELNHLLGDDEDESEGGDSTSSLVPGGPYSLEVSSPGLERVLKEPRHYAKAIGKKIAVKCTAPLLDVNPQVPELGKAKQMQGALRSYDEKGLYVLLDPTSVGARARSTANSMAKSATSQISDDEISDGDESGSEEPVVFVPFASVTKAHVVFEFTDPAEKKQSGQKGPHGKNGKKGSGKGSPFKGRSK